VQSRETEEAKRAYLGGYYISSTFVTSKNGEKDHPANTN
jgi:hypothetical protein